MPRTTAIKRSFDTAKVQTPVPVPVPVPVPTVNKPSISNILAESMTSGVGFGLGSALVRSMFGPAAARPAAEGLAVKANNEYEQCLEQNTDASACYNLSNQYKACMVRTNFNQNICTELYS